MDLKHASTYEVLRHTDNILTCACACTFKKSWFNSAARWLKVLHVKKLLIFVEMGLILASLKTKRFQKLVQWVHLWLKRVLKNLDFKVVCNHGCPA